MNLETIAAVHNLAGKAKHYSGNVNTPNEWTDAAQDVAANVLEILLTEGEHADVTPDRLARLVHAEAVSMYRADSAAQRNLNMNDGRTDRRAAFQWEDMSSTERRETANRLYSGDALTAPVDRIDAVMAAHSGVAGILHRSTNRTGRAADQQHTGENRKAWTDIHRQHDRDRLTADLLATLAPASNLDADPDVEKRRTMGGRWEPVSTGNHDGTVRYARSRQSGAGIGPWTLEHVHSAEAEALRRHDREALRNALDGHTAALAPFVRPPVRDRAGLPVSAWSLDWTALAAHIGTDRRRLAERAPSWLTRQGITPRTKQHRGKVAIAALASLGGHETAAVPALVEYGQPAPVPVERPLALGMVTDWTARNMDPLPLATVAPRTLHAVPVHRADYMVGSSGTVDRLTSTTFPTDRLAHLSARTDSPLTPSTRVGKPREVARTAAGWRRIDHPTPEPVSVRTSVDPDDVTHRWQNLPNPTASRVDVTSLHTPFLPYADAARVLAHVLGWKA